MSFSILLSIILDVLMPFIDGTGTPVGDPIECESIRKAFAGPDRRSTMFLGSVKANIGHAESASGVAALIKTVLMLQHKSIPVQANFKTLNPKIPALEPDNMAIARSTQIWNNSFRAACINNYGAAGSNAAMIVCQAPPMPAPEPKHTIHRYPIIMSAHTDNSLKRYCEALRAQISSSRTPSTAETLSSVAFNLATKQNRQLSRSIVTSAATISELSSKLFNSVHPQDTPAAKPVVLVFSGQTSDHVGLSETVYSGSNLFRRHLDHCRKVMIALNLPALFPGIFSKEPILDIVSLHCMLFSYQYASAMSWIDSGLQVDKLVGHSFGQLTALCVSGTLSLTDAMKMISGRASLVEKHWGEGKGSMLYVEGTKAAVDRLLASVNQEAEVACFNATNGFVVAGSKPVIGAIEKSLAEASQDYGISRSKRLGTTHAFHSKFTEPLLEKITALAEGLTFHEPRIPLETCTEGQSWSEIGPLQLSQHTRYPVYFSQAIARITDQLGACTWVGIGPGSTIINMVSRALGQSAGDMHSFQAVPLESNDSMDSLAEATANLWRLGHLVQFWLFHKLQRDEYTPTNLPPYQFEKSRHWLDYVDSIEVSAPAPVSTAPDEKISLLSPIKDPTQPAGDSTFLVSQRSDEFDLLASGHAVLGHPLCPVALYLELVVRGANMTQTDTLASGYDTSIESLEIKAPLGLDKNRFIKLTLSRVPGTASYWKFQLSSQSLTKQSSKWSVHATGCVLRSPRSMGNSPTEFKRFSRLVDYEQYCALMADHGGEAMHGKVIYKVFDQIVKYADYYRGVKSVSSKGNRVAGLIELRSKQQPQLASCAIDPIAIDNFLQVAGVHVNSLLPCADDEVYVATQVETIRFGEEIAATSSAPSWNVYSTCAREGPKEVINDIFVFNPSTKKLEMIILGAHFTKVLTPALTRALQSANPDKTPALSSVSKEAVLFSRSDDEFLGESAVQEAENSQTLGQAVREILSKLVDVSMDEINHDTSFEDVGIDSLMVNEVLSELHQSLGCEIPLEDFQQLQDINGLINYIQDRQPLSSDDNSTFSKSGTPMTITSLTPLDYSDDEIATSKPVPLADSAKLAQFLGSQLDIPATDIKEDSVLSDIGVDSLLTTEIVDDIEKSFGVQLDQGAITPETTFGHLCRMVLGPTATFSAAVPPTQIVSISTKTPEKQVPVTFNGRGLLPKDLTGPGEIFDQKIRFLYDQKAEMTKFSDFWTKVYPTQRRLVTAYTVEAFEVLGCSLASMTRGQLLLPPPILAKHTQCMGQLLQVLEEDGLIESQNGRLVRTSTVVDPVGSQAILDELLQEFPQHVSEHKLLQITGHKLGQCLSGAADPIQLIFKNKATKDLLTDVYTHAPMFEAGTFLLGDFLSEVFAAHSRGKTVRILELGGGTGGTTSYIANHLVNLGIKFTYTFTDLSPSLVAAAKKKFSSYDCFEYMVLDIEKTPPAKLLGQYDVAISTNCIHATKNLVNSLTNIRKTLNPTGFVSLVELTRNIPWFDLVFGLLEGWWLFNDGRKHALADVAIWDKSMKAAGFKSVGWSEGTPEAATLRVVAGFQEASKAKASGPATKKMFVETVTFKKIESNVLQADIYYPAEPEVNEKRPVGMSE
jgi:acyl carrier protein